MELTQSDKLAILAMTGNHSDDQGMEPMPPAPLFDYNAYRERIKERTSCVAVQSKRTPYVEYDECSEPDMYGTHCERVAIESADYLPSMRDRRAIRSELASMGCNWGE